jgi:hypothetical protein
MLALEKLGTAAGQGNTDVRRYTGREWEMGV